MRQKEQIHIHDNTDDALDLQSLLESGRYSVEKWSDFIDFEEEFAVLSILFYENLVILGGERYDRDDLEYYLPGNIYIYDTKNKQTIKTAEDMRELFDFDIFSGITYTRLYRNYLIASSLYDSPVIYDINTGEIVRRISDLRIKPASNNTDQAIAIQEDIETRRMELIGIYKNNLILGNRRLLIIYDLDANKVISEFKNEDPDREIFCQLDGEVLIVTLASLHTPTDNTNILYNLKEGTTKTLVNSELLNARYGINISGNYIASVDPIHKHPFAYDINKGEIITPQDLGLRWLDNTKGVYIYNNQLVLVGNFSFLIYDLTKRKVIMSPKDIRNIHGLSDKRYLTHVAGYKNYFVVGGYGTVLIYDLDKQEAVKTPPEMTEILKVKGYSFSSLFFEKEYIVFCNTDGSVTAIKLD